MGRGLETPALVELPSSRSDDLVVRKSAARKIINDFFEECIGRAVMREAKGKQCTGRRITGGR